MTVLRGLLNKRAIGAAATLVVISGALVNVSPASASGSSDKVISIAYSTDYVFGTVAYANTYFDLIKREYEKMYPGYKLNLIPISGAGTQYQTTLSIMYRSPSTAPDIAEVPTGFLGELVASNLALNLGKYVKKTSWWKNFPASIKAETTFDGTVYGVNEGMNNSALYYDKSLLRKAGISLPWRPNSWAQILKAAEAVKRTSPNVSPLWLMAGNGSGSLGALNGGMNLMLGSTTPDIETSHGKWVADSPGLRQVLGFYKKVGQKGLDAPLSELINPNALIFPEQYLAKNKVAIEIAGNYVANEFGNGSQVVGPDMPKATCSPCIKDAAETIGVSPIPHESGGGVVSALSGWDLPIYSGAKYPQATFNVINLIQSKSNSLIGDNAAAWPPDDSKYINAPLYDNFSPVFNAFFGKLIANSEVIPAAPDGVVWMTAFNDATETLLQNPKQSVRSVANAMKTYISDQIGASNTVDKP